MRADCGTENVHVAEMQKFFRSTANDALADDKRFLYGKLTSNQRIEAWWSHFRKCCAKWSIKYFIDLVDSAIFCDANLCHNNVGSLST